ncbi:MAG: hypothetical protein ACXVZP_02035 [Gaiellaceae bacterium]
MDRAEAHDIPGGPFAVRWLGYELDELRAGARAGVRVALENAGTADWRGDERGTVRISYHWLDELGNPIVWDGIRTPLRRVAPGESLELPMALRAPIPPGRYRLAIDLVDEHRCWFAELGNVALELPVEVLPRLARRALAVRLVAPDVETEQALADQEEALVDESDATAVAHLAPGCLPAPDWSRRLLDAHEEGYAVVAGSIDMRGGPLRRRPSELEPWAPGSGRIPGFSRPLLCPSIVTGFEAQWTEPVLGLPAAVAPEDEPWLYEGRIVLRARPRSGRRDA